MTLNVNCSLLVGCIYVLHGRLHSSVTVFADVLTSDSESDSKQSNSDGYENRQQDQLGETAEYRT